MQRNAAKPTTASEYYIHWLAALEKLVTVERLADERIAVRTQRGLGRCLSSYAAWQARASCVPGSASATRTGRVRCISVTRADGVSKEIRIQDGQLFVCNGCCCGQTEKGFPALPLEEFKRQWKSRGFRRRFHLTISGCLGPCPLANVVMIQFKGQSIWFHSINSAEDVAMIYSYVEHMLKGRADLDLPGELAGRHFQRYLVDSIARETTCET